MRSRLALWIRTMAGVLHKGRSLTQPAIFKHWKHRYAAASVVCHQNVLPSFVDRDVTGIRALGSDLVQQRQLAGCVVNREGADRSALLAFVVADFIDCVKEAMVWMNG